MTKEIILNMLSKGMVSIDSITLADYSGYEPDKCNNGGCYIYYETYTQTDSCSWVKTYSSSAGLDFDYCPCCGNFYTGSQCNHCDGKFEYVSTGDLIAILENYGVDEKHSIEIVYKKYDTARE